jgi:hypothetical protein
VKILVLVPVHTLVFQCMDESDPGVVFDC